MGELSERRSKTTERTGQIRDGLGKSAAIAKDKACVYATGSFGRGEASPYSDLDLFIVGKSNGEPEGKETSLLKRLDEIRIKAELIDLTKKLNIPEFSGDGEYLTHYSVAALTRTLGTRQDDMRNTFTARLLLLLESEPLVETDVYEDVISEVVAVYWRDFKDHKSDFMPAFLANDILRLWRTFCVNYEAGKKPEPPQKKAKGKLQNYKLKHSRLLTCYSSLLYLLALYRFKDTVEPTDAIEMVKLSPTGRLEWLRAQTELKAAHDAIDKLLETYEEFLATTNAPEATLIEQFQDRDKSHAYMQKAYVFGDQMFDALNSIGGGSRFHRHLVV